MYRPVVFFILGGTGDLARRKLYPAIQSMLRKGKLKNLSKIFALGRKREKLEETLREADEKFKSLFEFIEFNVESKESYKRLSKAISALPGKELIFYLALPPQLFEQAVVNLGALLRDFTNPRKLVIEKPFGLDLSSAKKLNFLLEKYFSEEEIYRIDHFLGKVPVQNIFALRFSNYIFEGVWNKNFIDHIQISALEEEGVEGRVGYYDSVGALRDMVQNHLLQILSFIAMEPPSVVETESIRDEKVKVLKSVRKLSPEEVSRQVVKAQYEGYSQEVGRVSNTETFVALKLYIDNFRWQDVPFYLRTGKRLKEKKTLAVVVFKKVPGNFRSFLGCAPPQNMLTVEIAPGNRLKLSINMISPQKLEACPLEGSMELDLVRELGEIPSAYETLIEDIISGDRTLFVRGDEVEAAWEIVQPILDSWEETKDIETYKEGTYGPESAFELIERDGRRWVN